MAQLLADYDSVTYGTKFFTANCTVAVGTDVGRHFIINSYHGKLSGGNVYCGLLRLNGSSGVRLGTLMLSLSPFSQRFTNTYDSAQSNTGTSTAELVPGYSDLYGYLVTNYNEAYSTTAILDAYVVTVPLYNNVQDFIDEVYRGALTYPITYRLTNCSAPSAPTEEAVGNTVNVDFAFPEGYGIVNPSSDIYVTNNGVVVPSSYANGRLTFTMPDPSQSG